MVLNSRVCFVVADGGHARLVWPAEDNALRTREVLKSDNVHKLTHDLVSDRPGRAFESGSTARHAYSPRHDPHDMEKQHFAHAVASRVNQDAADYDELVLVAPPHVLHDIEGALDIGARAKVAGTLQKDLTKVPDHELWPHLKQWVRPVNRA